MAKETPKGFVLLYDYKPHLSLLSDEERGQLLMALFDYGESGIEPELSGMALMAFSFIRGQMDRDRDKYLETCRKRSESGKRGGRPPKQGKSLDNKGESPPENQGNFDNQEDADESAESKESKCFSEKATKATESKKTQIKNKNKNKNINKSTINSATTPYTPSGGNSPDGEEPAEAAHVPYQAIVGLYHELCPSYPKLRSVSESRKKAIAARWKEYGGDLEIFRELFTKAEASKFLKGENASDRNWSADFNWLMNGENMAKVLEGKYDNKKNKNGSFDTDEFFQKAVARTFAEFEELERVQEQEGKGRFAKTAAEDPEIQNKADDLRKRLEVGA